ncbi:hypothetical protein K7432_001830 [Basidiobolus ranarum]|uniref:DUF218 domain-containing protein n=1 Tax=Basidiobolus ranarum TaxID=34480 RepID=A0ABR2W8Y8_9FUNG
MSQKGQHIRINIPLSEYSRPLKRPTKRVVLVLILSTLLLFTIIIHVFLSNEKTNPTSYQKNLANGLESTRDTYKLNKLEEIVIVAGHAIYKGNEEENQLHLEDNWVLEEFQKNGQIEVFLKHIEAGVSLAKDRPNSLLVFSGGQTRDKAGARSEAQSYWVLAEKMGLLDTSEILHRAVTEEHARDSYENILFSLCRFHEVTGSYPKNITIIGFEFKRVRFTEIHRKALGIPNERFHYIGIDGSLMNLPTVGESLNSLEPFKKDLYGCHGSLLEKKVSRNPFRQR